MLEGVREKKWLGNILKSKTIYLPSTEEVQYKRQYWGTKR